MASVLDFQTEKVECHCCGKFVRAAMSDLIDFACGEIVLSGQADVKKALIVTQIQVHLQLRGAIVSS